MATIVVRSFASEMERARGDLTAAEYLGDVSDPQELLDLIISGASRYLQYNEGARVLSGFDEAMNLLGAVKTGPGKYTYRGQPLV
ncbi:hypothetical protein A2716_02225 [candidate division WWE3 bacterium RIFCSPHIGHO2_01_FULL_40_23]|uniref:Uncharacterized protein n=1 Tax=candidate division WWE3 bacterium RIFCSPLOWO2_01_FULL_41_18 TaxID=1802625 RepID=A0A1F4VGF8_UNCKA|nr:MAG: hypothetical protein A2716_02225 [candidate division WWE3 bacterium RIFCSPHIGHO2_01_FULL_40_23]OGC55803.1 MAG: hypothetical protein A3A78_02075 [candidate division WWE3 bacterium RIFCSPLOWO2_01_FULL_41_18]